MIRPDDRTPEDRRQDAIEDAKAKPKGLSLPLSAEDNKPIWDAAGQLVSIPENAAAFAHAMNMHKRMADLLAATQIPLLNALVCMPLNTAKVNTRNLLDEIKRVVIEARIGARLKPVEEVGEEVILAAFSKPGIEDGGDIAKAIKAKFRVYSR